MRSPLALRWFALVTGVLAAATVVVAGPVAAEPAVTPAPVIPLPPELDPGFYLPPADVVAATAPGAIIAARQVRIADFGLLPVDVDAWQVSYRSNNSRDEAIPAVATLIKPRGQAPAPRKLLSVQLAEDSTAGYCAPSYALQHLSVAPVAGQVVVPAEFLFAQAALAQGWAVVVPDHQGPNSAYAAGPLAGRITLDGIRAATSFAPLEAGPDAPVGLYGYSGGSIATGHAAELKASYAPELNIVGAAEGGVGADLGAALSMANNQATSGLVFAAVLGLTREYPDFAAYLEQRLDPVGKTLSTLKAPLCVQYQSALLPFLNLTGMIGSDGNPLDDSPVAAMLDDTRMGKSVPDMPLFVWHSAWDEILPLSATNTLVDTYCRDPRTSLTYTRDHASEHIVAEVVGGPAALLWLRERLDGVPAPTGCTTSDAGTMAATPGALAFLGDSLAAKFASLFGVPLGSR
ncbi:triacylglycerol lipase [Nocardia asteroides NBRC 15531]|uniref:Lipase n=1 Tax=Nocardia asteroides NBRC 15531 TaxID=1110697 RepID=U5EK42_NOCAS|nr:lipase family protein [Nocardia asteroides]TLF62816.1 triacylglycerol lipase [Nocardia asteroides NBRC 15531]UGT46473.1 lipase family protein [Nocardia asteroides]SFN55641.1 triacylglycerol lipase [Nocardia asteroides]VEG34703.1 Secretory lipase [Nocardia asteroides]GAD87620.1 putative lipase [Nocardia asteroides NBRC 15531]